MVAIPTIEEEDAKRPERENQVGENTLDEMRRDLRAQRWYDTVAGLVALQAEYAAWHDALPDSLAGVA
jgi:hypothetical protein